MRWLTGMTIAIAGCATALSGGGWSTARPVPAASIQAQMSAYTAPGYVGASCSSPQDCTVVYQPSGRGAAVFSLTERDGAWGKPQPVPGLTALLGVKLGLACSSPGNCVVAARAATGIVTGVMVARLARGRWSTARPLSGPAGQTGLVSGVACGRAGWCAVAGDTGATGHGQPFVVSEHDGTWGQARAVPGLAALSQGSSAGVAAVSCDSVDTCTVVGDYRDHAVSNYEPYAVTDRAGHWGQVQPITGSASLGPSYVSVLSCSQPGDCTAAGSEGSNDTGNPVGMFTVTETGGTWHAARRWPARCRSSTPSTRSTSPP